MTIKKLYIACMSLKEQSNNAMQRTIKSSILHGGLQMKHLISLVLVVMLQSVIVMWSITIFESIGI